METVPNTFPGMFWSYLLVWIFLGGYILSMGVRLGRLERKFEDKSNEAKED